MQIYYLDITDKIQNLKFFELFNKTRHVTGNINILCSVTENTEC